MSIVPSEICYLCGKFTSSHDKMTLLFNEDGLSNRFYKKVQRFLDVKFVQDSNNLGGAPAICPSCKNKINDWEKYVRHVKSVQEFLQDMVEFHCKTNSYKTKSRNVIDNELCLENQIPSISDEEDPISPMAEILIKEEEEDIKSEENEDMILSFKEMPDGFSSDDEMPLSKIHIPFSTKSKKAKPSHTKILWECGECCHQLKSWSKLVMHFSDHHQGVEPNMVCGCGQTLYCRTTVIKHYRKHTSAALPKHKCDKCDKAYNSKRLLDEHSLSHLPKEEQPYLCCKCSRRFYSESLLKKHEKQHLPADQKPIFPCRICDKKLSTKAALATHIASIHLNHRSFVCDQCGLSFNFKGILQEHMLVHTNVCNFHCKECGKSFKTKYRLKNHIDTHLNTSYECPECGLSLNTRRTLRMHLLVHKDNRPHICSMCGKQFKRSKDLKNHSLLHTGQRPYTCSFCPRTFANGSNCRAHKKRMHPELLRQHEDELEMTLHSSSEQGLEILHKDRTHTIPAVKVERLDVYNAALDLGASREDPLFSQHSIFTS